MAICCRVALWLTVTYNEEKTKIKFGLNLDNPEVHRLLKKSLPFVRKEIN